MLKFYFLKTEREHSIKSLLLNIRALYIGLVLIHRWPIAYNPRFE